VTPDVRTTRLPHNLFVRVQQSPLNGDASYRMLMHQGLLRARKFRVHVTSCQFLSFVLCFTCSRCVWRFWNKQSGTVTCAIVLVTPHIARNSDSSIAFVRTVFNRLELRVMTEITEQPTVLGLIHTASRAEPNRFGLENKPALLNGSIHTARRTEPDRA
jgi:hypothetical protein